MSRQSNTRKALFLLLVIFPLTISFINSFPQPNQEILGSVVVNNSINEEITALYIYGNYSAPYADKYKLIFDASEKIRITTINITDLMVDTSVAETYNILIVGGSSFNESYVSTNPARSNAIINIGKPILSLGYGGNTFYQGLGYPYGGSSMGWSGGGIRVNASDATHEVFHQTYNFTVPGDITFPISSTTGLYMGNTYANTEFLATDDDTHFSHAPFIENTGYGRRMLQLGFWRTPTSEDNLYQLIHNCIEWLAGTPSEITVNIDDPLNNSIVESSSFTLSFSYSGEQSLIRAEVLINDESHLAGQLFIGLSGLSGSGSIEVDIGSALYLKDDWYKISVVVTDSLGWTGSVSIQVLRNEFADPILFIQAPSNNSYFYDDFYLYVQLDADNLTGTEYYLDGVYQGLIVDPPQGTFYGVMNLFVPGSMLTSGYHYFEFIAVGHPDDVVHLILGFFIEEAQSTETETATFPTATTTLIPETSTTIVTTTEDTSSQDTTTEPISTTTDPTIETTTTTTPTLNITPGFSAIVMFFALIVIIPIKKMRK